MSNLYCEGDEKRECGDSHINQQPEPGRSEFRKDYGRLIHTPCFRRLQGKTQLYPGNESDFFRNRLTHSLEVAQIALGITERLNAEGYFSGQNNIDKDLVQFAGLAHDLGHPPFGHNGEKALDELMKEHGGFEGNAQTLRILAKVEKKLLHTGNGPESGYGLNLTYRTLATILKYDREIPLREKNDGLGLVKGYYASERGLVENIKKNLVPGYLELPESDDKPVFKTIECCIMDIADDIAYSTYDLEDSLHAKYVTPAFLMDELIYNLVIREKVRDRTNKALNKCDHAMLRDDDELIEIALRIFDISTWVGSSSENEFERFRDVCESFRINKTFSEEHLFRSAFTSQRVSNLISSIEIHPLNERFPVLSGVRIPRDDMIEVEILKHLNYELVIRSPNLVMVEHRGKEIVTDIFKAIYKSKGDLLPDEWKRDFEEIPEQREAERRRVVCDFVAAMTDRYAIEFHQALFGGGKSIYKPL